MMVPLTMRGLPLLPLLLAAAAWPPAVPDFIREESAPPQCPQNAIPPVPPFSIEELAPRPGLPDFTDDLPPAGATEAARRTSNHWRGRPASETVRVGGQRTTAGRLAASLGELASMLDRGLPPADLRREIESRFAVLQAVTGSGSDHGIVTGYYDPEIPAEVSPAADHLPLHARPADLERGAPRAGFDYGRRLPDGRLVEHFSRAEITGGALTGRGLERFWVRHAYDLYNLQVQGSGWARLPNGSLRRLAFDGANGHPFRSVGQALLDCGILPPGTEDETIRRYLRSRPPSQEARLVNLNPRTVFFKPAAGGGPWGALGAQLTPGRSIAVDAAQVPLGFAALLVSRKPVADEQGSHQGFQDFARLVFTHDTGAAIRGPARVDLFWGSGTRAEAEARRMKFPGRLYLLVPKNASIGGTSHAR